MQQQTALDGPFGDQLTERVERAVDVRERAQVAYAEVFEATGVDVDIPLLDEAARCAILAYVSAQRDDGSFQQFIEQAEHTCAAGERVADDLLDRLTDTAGDETEVERYR